MNTTCWMLSKPWRAATGDGETPPVAGEGPPPLEADDVVHAAASTASTVEAAIEAVRERPTAERRDEVMEFGTLPTESHSGGRRMTPDRPTKELHVDRDVASSKTLVTVIPCD